MFEALVLQVEAVFQQTFLQVFGDVVQCHVNQYRTDHRCRHVEDDVQAHGVKADIHFIPEQPHRKHQQPNARHQRVKHLPPCIELQVFLVPRTHAGDADKQEGGNLAVHKVAVMVDEPRLHAVVHVTHDAVPIVEHSRVERIHEKLQQDGHVHHRPEYLVSALQFLAFFHFPIFDG